MLNAAMIPSFAEKLTVNENPAKAEKLEFAIEPGFAGLFLKEK